MDNKALIIGSTAVDVIIEIDNLPRTGEDINVNSQDLAVGGCAYNVASALAYFEAPFDLLSPVGTGYYGDYINKILSSRGFSTPLGRVKGDNGCCYCLVDKTGERSFICHRGAEYQFVNDFFLGLEASDHSFIYVCGLDLEGNSAEVILDYLEGSRGHADSSGYSHSTKLFFAPGPRVASLPQSVLNRILDLNPILHMNEEESAYLASQFEGIEELLNITEMPIIITKGAKGAEIYNIKDGKYVVKTDIPAFPVQRVVDTIGAGDSHAGGVISGLMEGLSISDAVARGNFISSKVIQIKGGTITNKM